MRNTCKIEGCSGLVIGWGWCRSHYKRWQRHGDPLAGGSYMHDAQSALASVLAVETDDCVLWPIEGKYRYPSVQSQGRHRGAHVVVCEHHYGLKPTSAHQVAHSCGVKRCVNYRHLRWATPAENNADKLQHGTLYVGEDNTASKLTVEQVREIRQRREAGERLKPLAAEFGVIESTISAVALRRKWAWLDPPPAA